MLLKLHGRQLQALGATSDASFVGRICDEATSTSPHHEILLTAEGLETRPAGFRAYLTRDPAQVTDRKDAFVLGPDFSYLADGDVVRIDPTRHAIHALYRRRARFNSFLVTERCDNYCVMCSQPPKKHDDSWIVDELLEVIPLLSRDTFEVCLTGGEPGLLGPRLIELVESLGRHLPTTAVHVLSNGRCFADAAFARALAKVNHPDLMIGIPLYADLPEAHDYVVQARGAFDETVRGILNLKTHGVRVELRFVVHRDTYEGLPAFARFVSRNLLFVDKVALMGLELMGFARANLDAIWIDPLDYHRELRDAVRTLDRAGMRVSIYNHQLCVLPADLHPFAVRSISDWKNVYMDDCERCDLRGTCGGFFASSTIRKSRGIGAVVADAAASE